jgi:UDP-N-acetylglucosamine acyltransferase
MTLVHPTAVVSAEAELDDAVEVGPFAVVEAGARLGRGVVLRAHAVVHGCVTLAERVTVAPHAVVGGAPQDLSFDPRRPSFVEVGAATVLREGVTVHRSTTGVPTRIGAGCLLMGHVHVAHDCRIGDGVVISQGSGLAGHVTVGDRAVIGGLTGIHQHVRVGRLAMVGGLSKITRDVLPFTVVDGVPASHWQVNSLGMRRSDIPAAEQRAVRRAFLTLQGGGSVAEEEGVGSELVRDLVEFHRGPSSRGIAPFGRGLPASRRESVR